jgi:2-polyprenyl-3-methyl-5-hydroxy-6-metoxy-1,4-benzoquinol methylase
MSINQRILKNKKITKLFLGVFIKYHNYLYHKIAEYSTALNGGRHPKHDILDHYNYFLGKINTDDTLIDIGCGDGNFSYNMAEKANEVISIDISERNIKKAKAKHQKDNIKYLVGDATQMPIDKKFDAIILSNVLEHIDERIAFLNSLHAVSDKILLRVPMINRDWISVYKKNNGYEYRLDTTHFIEYTLESLKQELRSTNWELVEYQVNFAEIWGVVRAVNELK